jgi:pimeloyl-ACP methyl ester carboxylesterase
MRNCLSIVKRSSFLMLLLTGCASQIMLHPKTARQDAIEHPVDPLRNGDRPEVITVTNQYGRRLTGWVFASPTNHGVVLVGDGNATGLVHTYDYNRFLLHRGFNVVVLSYQGFDANEGRASLDSLPGDVAAFYSFCQQRFPGEPIALVAESMSTAPFFGFASHHSEIAGLVLEGMVDPKTVALSKVNEWWLFYPFYPSSFVVASLIGASVPRELSVQRALKRHPAIPALFIHHPNDRVTPYGNAHRIFEQYPGPKELIILHTEHSLVNHMTANSDPAVCGKITGFLKEKLSR